MCVCVCVCVCVLCCALRFGEAPTADQVKEFNRVSSHFFEQHPGEIIGESPVSYYHWPERNAVDDAVYK